MMSTARREFDYADEMFFEGIMEGNRFKIIETYAILGSAVTKWELSDGSEFLREIFDTKDLVSYFIYRKMSL